MKTVWIQDSNGIKIKVALNKLICIIQPANAARERNFYLINKKAITISKTWQECYELLDEYGINYFVTKSRSHLVVKEYIEKFEKPFISLTDGPCRLEVAKEKIKEFEEWLGIGRL
jgi:hypothetical protein